ncbi:hypothetical protein ACIBO9_43185 [Streptomyces prunicolor]|uniref:hypothetical protein n=1 Tax=Streptomyces prunicolor TaxID=67348 RepID=UPI0037D0171A
MCRNRPRLAALLTALAVVLALILTGGPAGAESPSPEATGTGEAKDSILLVPAGKDPTDKELDDIARKVVRDGMGQRYYLAKRRFDQLDFSPANTSVAFFNFGWIAEGKNGLPDWVVHNYQDFMYYLYQEIRSPSTRQEWRYPLTVEMLNSDDYSLDRLFGQLGVHPLDGYGNEQVLEIATGSAGTNKHSEDNMEEWVSRTMRAVLLKIARTESQRGEITGAIKTIKENASAGIVGPRTYCDICKERVPEAGYNFRRELFITYYDKKTINGKRSPDAVRSSKTLKGLEKKLDPAYKDAVNDDFNSLRKMLELNGPCQGENNASSMNLAAKPLAADCGEDDSSGLAGALASQSYGGVDFSSLQLRYLSDDPGSGVKYAFSAKAARKGLTQDSPSGRSALMESMAGLRTWLALKPDTFWVNLNPDEPDRIIDAQLGRTNAGRALLEADWQMKRTEGKLLDPKTTFGREYWEKLGSSAGEICYSSRMWIVPGEVQVHQEGDSLYVLKADLQVKAKAQKVAGLGQTSCNTDPAETARNEQLEQEMVVPKITKAVNTDPEYAPLRQAFLARVVAQWIRDRHDSGHTTSFDKLINSGDLGPAATTGTWKPQQVYDRYLRSIKDGDFTYKRTTRVGNTTVTYVMTTGGVDFSKLNTDKLSATDMDRQVPGLPQVVQKSVGQPMRASDGSVWLGDRAKVPPISTWDRISSFLSGRTGILVVLLVALGVLLFFIRDGSAFRRRPSG